jgi:hypothetical protein
MTTHVASCQSVDRHPVKPEDRQTTFGGGGGGGQLGIGVRCPSGARDQMCVIVTQLWVCRCAALCLTRGLVCSLQLLLGLASAVILGAESHRTHDHILLSHVSDSPNLEGQVPVFISLRNRVAQLHPPVTGCLSSCNPKSESHYT